MFSYFHVFGISCFRFSGISINIFSCSLLTFSVLLFAFFFGFNIDFGSIWKIWVSIVDIVRYFVSIDLSMRFRLFWGTLLVPKVVRKMRNLV